MAKDKTKYVGERYESKHGKYEIIEYIGGSHSKVKVKFDLTGSEVICRYDTAYKGFALDPNYVTFLYVGKTYDTCCGPVTILRDLGYNKKKKHVFVWIRFELTGYECEERLKNILNGYANDPGYFMYTVKDKIFHSNSYGDYKIIAEANSNEYNMKMVRIKFILTGYEYDVRYDAARDGKVKDPTYFMHTVKDKIFHSNNYGDFKIIKQTGFTEDKRHRIVKIKFLISGAETTVKYDDILNGEVQDPSFKNKYHARNSIGSQQIVNTERVLKKIWSDMMNRCYNINIQAYKSYGARGVTVASEWHDYNNFRRDIELLPGWMNKFNDPVNYHLDKDLLQYTIPHSSRVYSKDTCVWLRADLNEKLPFNAVQLAIYYNSIYQINELYFVKTLSPLLLNYGPFTSLDAAINMANRCYASVGLNQLIIPTNNIMQIQQIFQYTDDRKIAIKRVK